MTLRERTTRAKGNSMAIAAMLTATLAILLAANLYLREVHPGEVIKQETAMARIRRTGVLRAAYGGFPPYTIVDPTEQDPNKRVSGFTVDMINEIAKRWSPPLHVEWFNLNWETFRADMLSGRFDVVADAVYATIPKAEDFGFTEPFSYFGLDAAVVRVDDNRFKTFEDLDRPDITIVLAQGYVSNDYAQGVLSKPKFKLVTVGKDAFSQMDDVLLGHSDVALNDVPTVVQYVTAHADKVKALWVNNPPSWAVASFVTRRGESDLNATLSTDILILRVDGTLARLDRKWKSLGFFDRPNMIPGAGLQLPSSK